MAEVVESPGFDMIADVFAHQTRAPFPVPLDEVVHGAAAFEAIVASARGQAGARVMTCHSHRALRSFRRRRHRHGR